MNVLTLRSPAKLNLYLKVKGKRKDGYHELVTLFERIDLADEIRFRADTTGRIKIICDDPDVPKGKKNLIVRAARLLQDCCGVSAGAEIHVIKRIPVAAGLAGGSSNAATTLLGLNRLWKLGLPRQRLVELGRQLGSDVPFFLYQTSWALGRGRGDLIRPLDLPVRLQHVLVVPRLKMYSREVFTRLNLQLTKTNDNVNILLRYLKKNNIIKAADLFSNDLEGSILRIRPNLLKVQKRLLSSGVVGASFSGSGPAVFGIVSSQLQAESAVAQVGKYYRKVFAVKTL